jgi:putative N6-adenine-specific DNA methylase
MAATRANLARTPWLDSIKLVQKDFTKLEGPYPDRVIVANPPYGVRLEDTQEGLQEFYKALGQFLKVKCGGSKAYVLIPEGDLHKEIWFKPERRLDIDNGALLVTVAEYAILPSRPAEAPKAARILKAEAAQAARPARLGEAPADAEGAGASEAAGEGADASAGTELEDGTHAAEGEGEPGAATVTAESPGAEAADVDAEQADADARSGADAPEARPPGAGSAKRPARKPPQSPSPAAPAKAAGRKPAPKPGKAAPKGRKSK